MCYSVYIYKYSWHLAKCSSKKTDPLKSSAQTIKENTTPECYTQSLMFSWEMLPSEAVPVNLNGSTAMETGVFWSRRRTWYNWAFVCARWLPHSTYVCSEGWWCVSSEMSIHKLLCTHGRQGKYRELTQSEVGRHIYTWMLHWLLQPVAVIPQCCHHTGTKFPFFTSFPWPPWKTLWGQGKMWRRIYKDLGMDNAVLSESYRTSI